jgi:hypothetical protein
MCPCTDDPVHEARTEDGTIKGHGVEKVHEGPEEKRHDDVLLDSPPYEVRESWERGREERKRKRDGGGLSLFSLHLVPHTDYKPAHWYLFEQHW